MLKFLLVLPALFFGLPHSAAQSAAHMGSFYQAASADRSHSVPAVLRPDWLPSLADAPSTASVAAAAGASSDSARELSLAPAASQATAHAATPADYLGVVASANADPSAIKRLGLSRFISWTSNTPIPAGMTRVTYVAMTAVREMMSPDALTALVRANPGSAWLMGNEPNVPNSWASDSLSPRDYATQLHRMEAIMHAADPTATLVGPNVIDWSDTCVGCEGITSGQDWTAAFYAIYAAQYGVRPPIDRWSVHTYELNWQDLPMLDSSYHIRQLLAMRSWLDAIPAEAGAPIWDTELGFLWGYPGFQFDSRNKLQPVGDYAAAGVLTWLSTMLNWLGTDGLNAGVQRSFLFGQWPAVDTVNFEVYGGLSLFAGGGPTAPLTEAGQTVAQFVGAALPGSASVAAAGTLGGAAGSAP